LAIYTYGVTDWERTEWKIGVKIKKGWSDVLTEPLDPMVQR